jgi:hypothetical protein
VEYIGRIVPSLQDVFIDLVEHQTKEGTRDS